MEEIRLNKLKKNMEKIITTVRNLWAKTIEDKFYLSLLLFVVILGITIFLFLLAPSTDFTLLSNNLKAPMITNVINVSILVLLFNWLNKIGDRKKEIERYLKEINDLRYSESQDSIFRIIGRLRSLEPLERKESDILDLTFINFSIVSSADNLSPGFLKNLNLSNSKLFKTDFSNLKMPHVVFNKSKGSELKFVEFESIKGQFKDCDFMDIDFCNAYLSGADFSNSIFRGNCSFKDAVLENSNFKNVHLPANTDFEGARVSPDFFDKVKGWNLKGEFQFKNYEIYEMKIDSGSSWFLRKKTF